EVLILSILRLQPRISSAPQVMFYSTDPAQRFTWRARNKFTIEGVATHTGMVRSFVHLTVDGLPVKFTLNGGENPLAVASRLRAVLPTNYQTIIKLPMY